MQLEARVSVCDLPFHSPFVLGFVTGITDSLLLLLYEQRVCSWRSYTRSTGRKCAVGRRHTAVQGEGMQLEESRETKMSENCLLSCDNS